MKSARSFKEFEALNGISMEEVLTVFEAVSEAFPMIVAANLTKIFWNNKRKQQKPSGRFL